MQLMRYAVAGFFALTAVAHAQADRPPPPAPSDLEMAQLRAQSAEGQLQYFAAGMRRAAADYEARLETAMEWLKAAQAEKK